MKKIIIVAVAAAFAAIPGIARAEAVRTQVSVSYADLNLASPAGEVALDRRIRAAATKACATDRSERDLTLQVSAARCRTAAIAKAKIAAANATSQTFAAAR